MSLEESCHALFCGKQSQAREPVTWLKCEPTGVPACLFSLSNLYIGGVPEKKEHDYTLLAVTYT
jgi:hypothetical protein